MMPRVFGLREYVPIHWTLYIELQFYFLMGLLAVVKLRRQIPTVLLGFVILATLGSLGYVPQWSRIVGHVSLLNHLHLFLFGICLYRWSQMSVTLRWTMLVACAINTITYGSGLSSKPYGGTPYPIAVFALAGLFVAAVNGRARWLEKRWLIGLGAISYSLYLMHEPFGDTFFIWGSRNGLPLGIALPVAFIVALTLATFSTFFVERPSHEYLSKLWKRFRKEG